MAAYALPLLLGGVLPPLYRRPPGAENPAMGFAATVKILVKMTSFGCDTHHRTKAAPIKGRLLQFKLRHYRRAGRVASRKALCYNAAPADPG
jgi:hypothetical protein